MSRSNVVSIAPRFGDLLPALFTFDGFRQSTALLGGAIRLQDEPMLVSQVGVLRGPGCKLLLLAVFPDAPTHGAIVELLQKNPKCVVSCI